jgi:hypothetical protein
MLYQLNIYSDPSHTVLITSAKFSSSGTSFAGNIDDVDGNKIYLDLKSMGNFNFNLNVTPSNSVGYQWRYEDQLKIVGIILEMCGIYLKDDKIIQYAKMFGEVEP